jgi:hypothetical protein
VKGSRHEVSREKLSVFIGLVSVDIFKKGESRSIGTSIKMLAFRGYANLIFYPPTLSFIKFRQLPVDKPAQNLVTVLVTVVFL